MATETAKQEKIKNFADSSPCICFNVRKASKVITSIYEQMFKPLGITAPQAALLATVRRLGPLTVNELAEAVATDRTTLTRNLKILERDSLVNLKPGADKRVKEVSITATGKDISNESSVIFQRFQDKVHGAVGEERLDALCHELSDVMEKIKQM